MKSMVKRTPGSQWVAFAFIAVAVSIIGLIVCIIILLNESKYVYPGFRKEVASVEELRRELDGMDFVLPDLETDFANGAAPKLEVLMDSPYRSAKGDGYCISNIYTSVDCRAVDPEGGYVSGTKSEYRGAHIWLESRDYGNHLIKVLVARFDGFEYTVVCSYDHGRNLTGDELIRETISAEGRAMGIIKRMIDRRRDGVMMLSFEPLTPALHRSSSLLMQP